MAASGDIQFELALVAPEPVRKPPPTAVAAAPVAPVAAPSAAAPSAAAPSAAAPASAPPPESPPRFAVPPAGTLARPRRTAAAPRPAVAQPLPATADAAIELLAPPLPPPPPAPLAGAIAPARLPRPLRRLRDYAHLLRLDRPIGTYLLLWPMLWAIWIAANGHPQRRLLALLLAGGVLMRSAGCIINDVADRNIDPHVRRTRARPLAARALSPTEALAVFGVLMAAALWVVLQLNAATLRLAFIGAGLTITYPLFKRFFPLPQLYLGLCFGWAVPMAFTATLGTVPQLGWLMLVAAILWAGIYDTMYAMVDRDDGVRSSAILFADLDRFMIAMMQVMMMLALVLVGRTLKFGDGWYAGLVAGAGCFLWQQWLIRNREPAACFEAFKNNNYFGVAIFAGVLLQYTTN